MWSGASHEVNTVAHRSNPELWGSVHTPEGHRERLMSKARQQAQ